MDTVALLTSVTASAMASSAARDAFRDISTFVGGFEVGLEVGGEAALDAGEEVAVKQSEILLCLIGFRKGSPSTLGRLAVEKRRRCRSVEGLGGPRGRRKCRIGWARAILNPQSLIQLPNYWLILAQVLVSGWW